jgi:cytochrome c oxidase assembly factor CtaG
LLNRSATLACVSPRSRATALAGSIVAALAAPPLAAAHVASVPPSQLGHDWHAPPAVLAVAAGAAVLFVQAFVRLRRRGRVDHAGWDRPALFAAGLALGVVPLVSPLDAAGDHYLVSAHMLQHVLIGDAAPLLLVLAVRGPLAFFLLPPTLLKPLASSGPLRAFLRTLLRPSVTFGLWVAFMLGWHVPAAYDYTLTHPVVHDLEHATFVLVGTLAWMQLIDPARRASLSRGRRIAFAFGLLVLSHPISDGLIFTRTAVYHPYAIQPHRVFGLGVLTDQRLAGLVMVAEQLLTLGTFIAVLLWPLLRRRSARTVALQRPA